MRSKFLRNLIVGFLAITVFYILYNLISLASPDITVETATLFSVSDSVDATGIAVREEHIIAQQEDGIREYLVENGEKVARGSVVANVYDSPQTVANALDIKLKTQQLENLSLLQGVGDSGIINVTALRQNIYRTLADYSGAISNKNIDYSLAYSLSSDIERHLNGYAAVSGNNISYEDEILMISDDIERLKTSPYQPSDYIYSDADGFFVASCDGYETAIDPEGLLEMNVSDIETLINDDKYFETSDQCKIMNSYIWYFAAVVEQQEAERLFVGADVNIEFNYDLVGTIKGVVSSILTDDTSNKSIVVFECDNLSPDIVRLRIEDVEINFYNYNGIKIDRSYLRTEEGALGVFVQYGTEVQFKPIENETVLYETDEFLLIQPSNGYDGGIELYDNIVIAGRDLYDGKQVR